MIGYLKGKIIRVDKDAIIVAASDVGYKIYMAKLSAQPGDIIELHIHHHIREDQSTLYGFISLEDLNFFELLLTVSGVGPKLATTVLANIAPNQAIEAIKEGQSAVLQAIPGVGAKAAAKITLELKGKITSGEYSLDNIGAGSELIDALHRLGYKNSEIAPAVKNIPAQMKNIEDKIRWVLKNMGKTRI